MVGKLEKIAQEKQFFEEGLYVARKLGEDYGFNPIHSYRKIVYESAKDPFEITVINSKDCDGLDMGLGPGVPNYLEVRIKHNGELAWKQRREGEEDKVLAYEKQGEWEEEFERFVQTCKRRPRRKQPKQRRWDGPPLF